MISFDAQQIMTKTGVPFCENEPLANHTTMKVGGNADFLFRPASAQALSALVTALEEVGEPYFILGNGSNIIASDEGFRGAVIKLGRDFAAIRLTDECEIECEAGAQLAAVCKFALEHSLTGLEFAYGIPGTVGGALYMNAGAYGGEMSQVAESCTYLHNGTEIRSLTARELELSYRHSCFSGKRHIITTVRLKLQHGDAAAIRARMEELMARRRDKQPLEYPSAGSMFKRPEGYFAAALIEQCGLKGLRVGGAEVSKKHSGFVINAGGATAGDIKELTERVKDEIYGKTGIRLETEPIFLG